MRKKTNVKRITKSRFWDWLVGTAPNPFNPNAFKSIALISFLAWVGLGADGLSSSCYGPEEAYLALGSHHYLALFIAIATAFTVFIISLGYNQVVELFPSGGGGYKVSTQLLGKYVGLISGSALIVDYVLTIAISTASGIDALFSFLPEKFLHYKLITEILTLFGLMLLNLRGMKESIKILMPIFLGFVITHFSLIVYGIYAHHQGLTFMVPHTIGATKQLAGLIGWFSVSMLILHSYSLGGGTYTGLEAVSNNVNRLAEPRIRTGKITMFYMAISLSFTAAGIILLYLLWHAKPVIGETLNAVVFHSILGNSALAHLTLVFALSLEAGILLVAANTGFLAGPMVLANMAVDGWLPNRFRHLSSRLVTQNGIILFGIAALLILIWTRGAVSLLVVLYSINVFLTFSTTLLGLSVYWIKRRKNASLYWIWKLCLAFSGFLVTASILIVTLLIKFTEGGWLTVFITCLVVIACLFVKRHYHSLSKKLAIYNRELIPKHENDSTPSEIPIDHQLTTAVFFIGEDTCVGMHTLLWAIRLFPGHFKNFVFVKAGIVDIESFSGKQALLEMQNHVEKNLNFFVNYCRQHGLPATSYAAYGTDPIEHLVTLSKQISHDFPNAIFFASRLIFEKDNWVTRFLHNETPVTLQRRLHALGKQLIILPMKI